MKSGTPTAPIVPLLLALTTSLALWGVLLLGAASIWSQLFERSVVAAKGEIVPQLASWTDQALVKVKRSTSARGKATQRGRSDRSFAARVFSRSSSL